MCKKYIFEEQVRHGSCPAGVPWVWVLGVLFNQYPDCPATTTKPLHVPHTTKPLELYLEGSRPVDHLDDLLAKLQ